MTEQSILRRRVEIFDGLRAVAILGVFNIHFFAAYSERGYLFSFVPLQKLFATIHAGIFGVPLFFILSGYLIYGRYLAHSGSILQKAGALNFLKKRAVRLVPVYLLCLLVLFLIPKIGVRVASAWELFCNLTLVFLREAPDVRLYNPVAWSLAIEFQYALIVGISMLASARFRKPLYFSILALYAISYYTPLNTNFPIYSPDNILCLVLGSVLYEFREANPVSRVPAFLPAAGALFVCYMWGNHNQYILGKYGYVAVMSALDLMMFVLLSNLISTDGAARRFLETRPMVALGKASYSFYLFHYWTIGYLMNFVLGTGRAPEGMGVRYLVCLAATIAISTASYWIAEHPTIKINSNKAVQPALAK